MIITFKVLSIFSGTESASRCQTNIFVGLLLGRRLIASWLILVALSGMGCRAVQAQSQLVDGPTSLPRMQSTPPLRSATPPEPVETEPSDTAGYVEVMRLSEQSLPAQAQTEMRIALHAPTGWQVNGRAPGVLTVSIQGKGAEVPATYAKQTIRPMAPQLAIPLQITQSGATALLRVDLSFVLCRKGDQAVCVLRQVAWEVPVRSQSQAAQTKLVLYDRMATIAREFAD